MTDWLARARSEIPKKADQGTIVTVERNAAEDFQNQKAPGQGTLVTVERNPTSATIVPHPAKSAERDVGQASNECNDSTSPGHFQVFKSPTLTAWRESIEGWQPATSDMLALKEKALQFLSSKWAQRAVDAGWNAVDLFGLLPNARAACYRYGTWGLVTHLGLSIHKPEIVAIGKGRAALRTEAGATHIKPRVLPEAEISRPFWECVE